MAAMAQPNITQFYIALSKAKTQQESASIISQAMGELKDKQEVSLKESLKELATQKDLQQHRADTQRDLKELRMEVKLDTAQMIASAKWQLVGVILVAFFGQVVLKHFGVF